MSGKKDKKEKNLKIEKDGKSGKSEVGEKVRDPRRAQKRGIIIAFAVMAAIVLVWYVVLPAVGALIEQ